MKKRKKRSLINKFVILACLLFIPSIAYSAWRFNPYTGEKDYYEPGSTTSFLNLNDTPTSYAGQGGKVVAVKVTEDGLEFTTAGAGSGDITAVGSCTSGDCFVDGTNHTLTFEGATNDLNEIVIQAADPTADRTITLPDETGTVCTTGSVCSGYESETHASEHEAGGSDPINHDNLTGFVANEHIDHSAVTITAGAGLSGGGDITASMTLQTASQEAGFLADGGVTNLTCGAGNAGKVQVMDNGSIQYCDGAATSVLRSGFLDADGVDDTGTDTLDDLSDNTTDDLPEGTTNLYSQWSENGTNIYYNGGNVGIGTNTPTEKLEVNGNAVVSGDLTVNGTNGITFQNGKKIKGTSTDRIDVTSSRLSIFPDTTPVQATLSLEDTSSDGSSRILLWSTRDTMLSIQNSHASYVANVDIEGGLNFGGYLRKSGTDVYTFKTISDGVNTASADDLFDTLRFRSSDGSVSITVTNDDPTYGDVINLTATGGGGGAPVGAEYIVAAADATLTNEHNVGKTDDTVIVANGTTWEAKTLPSCTDTGGNHLNYDPATNTFSCGTSGDGKLSTTGSVELSPNTAHLVGAFITMTPTGGDAASGGAQINGGDGVFKLLFDAATDEAAVWQLTLPKDYSSTPKLAVTYAMTSATTGTVEFEGAIRCITSGDAEDVDAASGFSSIATATETVPATAGYVKTLTITLNDDSCAAGDLAIVYLSTDANDATNDTATGDREVLSVQFIYTRS
ncbi:MAG: hypothetical protein KatS3mg087_1621 [Patescibacteria group bacterium]|nr:MAG: hypothetical protein KatS3mg087_1621 [Patescibacteria group bacterium]